MDTKTFTALEWHQRFNQQAQWTQSIRKQLFTNFQFPSKAKILEVGCGTGSILSELSSCTKANLFGLDFNQTFLHLAKQNSPNIVNADAYSTPFQNDSFDLVCCHYFLLWIKSPISVMREIKRIIKPNGNIFIFAEPYYSGRIDFPFELGKIGKLQREALVEQGADPDIGPTLSRLLNKAGFRDPQTGLLGGQWKRSIDFQTHENEWKMVSSDLASTLEIKSLREFQQLDKTAWDKGERILYVPTFYAWAKK